MTLARLEPTNCV